MIEKILKAVKSSNKKRGKNITVGAVVGMLLSCTTATADEFLWIRENGGEIEYNTKVTTNNSGSDGNWDKEHPYEENKWEGNTYINNMRLSVETKNGKDERNRDIAYGLRVSGNLEGINLVNNGNIYSKSDVRTDGIFILSSPDKVTNKGVINTYGQGTVINGINVTISDSENSMKNKLNLSNEGIIKSYNASSSNARVACGINFSKKNLGDNTINNSGLIFTDRDTTGTGYSYGINILNSTIKDLTNSGIVYGRKSAISCSNTVAESLPLNNYGVIVNSNNDGISVDTVKGDDITINNYGLIFKDEDGTYKAKDDNDFTKFGTTTTDVEVAVDYDENSNPIKEKYTVINAKANNSKDDIQGTESLTLSDGKLSYKDSSNNDKVEDISLEKKYILNGIENTLKVVGNNKGNGNILSNGIVNAYGTAVKFEGTSGNSLTLIGTKVNGGLKADTVTIKGSTGADTLILKDGTVINGKISMGTGSDNITIENGAVINGDIVMGTEKADGAIAVETIPDNNILTIENGVQINGALNGGIDNSEDILNFNGSSSNEEIRILHDISNFEKINIGTNVTFYENNLEVTDVENLTISKNGVLTLRIDTANGNAHALTGNTGTIKSVDGGKLLLALNGAGKTNTISFGDFVLDESLVTGHEGTYKDDVTLETTSALHSVKRTEENNEIEITAKVNLPPSLNKSYEKLNKVYKSLLNEVGNFNVVKDDNDKSMSLFLAYLNDIYAGNPYSYSSELSRKSAGMFRDIVTENQFKPNLNKWMIYGGLTHVDVGTKDTYYGKGCYTYDIGSSDIDADSKITGAYMLGEYGVSDTLTSGVIIGGNKLKSDLSNGSKVDGSALYLGAYTKKYIGNLKVTAGAGFQYGDYDADRLAVNKVASSTAEPVMKYSDSYNDVTYDIYLNGRYSNPMGDNFFLEPYATLSYTYVDQDGADEGNKVLAIETDSKSFDYTVGKVGVDLKKVIPHEKGKSTVSAGISYTKMFDGAEEEYITGRFKGGTDFDILVAHKNEHSIGLNAKYVLELENGVLLDVKGTYSIERDSHNGSGKNRTKGEWIVGAGLGYKF